MNKSETNTDENFPDNIPPSNTGDAETPAAYLYSEEKQPDEETLKNGKNMFSSSSCYFLQ
jgi:hypothetical protein